MHKVVERVMQTFGLMKPMSDEETEQTRKELLDFLSKRSGTDERKAAVESLIFLKNLKTWVRSSSGLKSMYEPLPVLLENAFQIAWEYLEGTGNLGDAQKASRFLSDTIEQMIRQGTRNKLILANKAINQYRSTNCDIVSIQEKRLGACRT